MTSVDFIEKLLTRGVANVIVRKDLEARLRAGDKLRLKLGIDPTGAELHIGHAVVLRKMRAFQNLGHTVVIVVGDYTARIGDPTDRDKMREPLTAEKIAEHLKTFERQALKVLDPARTEFRYQSEWYDSFGLADVLELAQLFTVQQFLERDMYQKRIAEGRPIGLHEFVYPLMQGYDSVPIQSDIEFGGSDQLFNNLAGRPIQEHFGQRPQDVLVAELLPGLDGRKMSKSYGNYVAIETAPEDMYGKLMTLHDDLLPDYFRIATELPQDEIDACLAGNPRDAKARLAQEIVTMFHSPEAAQQAEAAFDRLFRKKQVPEQVEEKQVLQVALPLFELLVHADLAKSTSEARRLIEQGGVHVDGIVEKDPNKSFPTNGLLLQVGKRHFRKIRN